MKISELPTPRLRVRAYALAYPKNDTDYFRWRATREGDEFWYACHNRDWNKAKELPPDLFKPVDGKPHIVLQGLYGIGMESDEALFLGYALDCVTEDRSINLYLLEVQSSLYETIQEAVDALYSFKRATDVAGEVV